MVHRVRVTVGLDQNDKESARYEWGSEDNGNITYKDPEILKTKTKITQNTLPTSSVDIIGR